MSHPATIRVLDALTIDQMAAGEVVERPASVAKELVENAFDAGACNVEVLLTDGGLSSMVVVDDGSGMLPEDADRCILRHATSKLRHTDDLMALSTLGFRGEALSSISAVSRFTLTTRPPTEQVGYRIVVHGGVVHSARPVGCPVGTQIAVEDLFYNVPARRKFMRAKATEQAHVQEALLKVALASPQGGVVLRAGARRLLDVPQKGTAVARAQLALGQSLGTTVMIDKERDGVAVSGVLAAQPLERGEGRRVWLFVNGRFVRDRSLQRAALAACGQAFGALTPTALIYLAVPPGEVDVNVHPQKLEVRFARGAAVHGAVTAALEEAAAAWQRAERDRCQAAAGPMAAASSSSLQGPAIAYAFEGQRAFRGATGPGWRGAPGSIPRGLQRAEFPEPVELPERLPAAPSLPGLEVPGSKTTSLWRALVPLGVAPEGYLCCRHGADLVLVHLQDAERAVLLQQLLPLGPDLAGSALMMPPTWAPDGALHAAVDDYLIETALRPSPWGVTLEAVGPGAFVVVAVPAALAAFAPATVAEQLIVALQAVGGGCHQAYQSDGERVVRQWLDGVLSTWPGPGQGSAVVWGPTFLRRLHTFDADAARPLVCRLTSGIARAL